MKELQGHYGKKRWEFESPIPLLVCTLAMWSVPDCHLGLELFGQFRNPAGGDYTIHWDSGTYGIQYDDGINPRIAINNHNQVVELHQVLNESILHYRRGTLSGGTIHFTESMRYEDDGKQPAVALLDTGEVVELHISDLTVHTRSGELSTADSATILWDSCVTVYGKDAEYPALTATGHTTYRARRLRCAYQFPLAVF